VNRLVTALVFLAALLPLAGCATGYPGYGTPSDALQTYFASARKADYSTTYNAYYEHYRDLVTRDEFVSHRRQASVLQDFRVDTLASKGDSAVATVTLTFAPSGKSAAARVTTVREDLVRERGGWKIRVW
jgi:hypothetical protein